MFDDFMKYCSVTDCQKTLHVDMNKMRKLGLTANDVFYVYDHFDDLKEQFGRVYGASIRLHRLCGTERKLNNFLVFHGYKLILNKLYGGKK